MKIYESSLSGKVNIPPSKSYAHRAILSAALADGESIISNVSLSDDIQATLQLAKDLGANIIKMNNVVKICGIGNKIPKNLKSYKARESGSSLRFIIPILFIDGSSFNIKTEGKLSNRPLDPYFNICKEQNIYYHNDENGFSFKGKLSSGTFKVDGSISSQFITGLLYALPLLKGDSKIIITNKLQSRAYVDLTLEILKISNIKVVNNNYEEFIVKGNQKYKSFNYDVEGDFSQAAFFIVAATIGKNPLTLANLNKKSKQADSKIIDIVKRMGGNIDFIGDDLYIQPAETTGIDIDVSEIPDLGPILTVLGIYSKGITKIYNAKRLRVKECDRITCVREEMIKFGVDIVETEDSLTIKENFNASYTGNVSSHNDHRLAMMLAIMMLRAKGEINISDYLSVTKSYPNFWEVYKNLGGNINE